VSGEALIDAAARGKGRGWWAIFFQRQATGFSGSMVQGREVPDAIRMERQ